ncbi:MAG TPA: hypothetical protein VMS43_15505 [Allosphingosinicella sp.]|nr:hypothetical protein [Allosphingosinicella sp.]
MIADPFVDIVKLAGFLVTAAVAIGFTWRRRAKWEPDISDVPKAPEKVAGLLTAVLLGILWFDAGRSVGLPPLQQTALIAAIGAVIGLLVYVFLTTVFVYERQEAVSDSKTRKVRIIGGLWLSPMARAKRRQGHDIQSMLSKAANNPDVIWPRSARGLAQSLFIIAYISLICGGSLALSAVALLVRSAMS